MTLALGFSSAVQTKIRLEYVISFSDAIFAFSITFMAISIQIPSLPENLAQTQVIESLVGELELRLAIYVISFFVIGLYWISYHQIFNNIVGSHAIIV
jgi:TMEM175 potassium channel family protein